MCHYKSNVDHRDVEHFEYFQFHFVSKCMDKPNFGQSIFADIRDKWSFDLIGCILFHQYQDQHPNLNRANANHQEQLLLPMVLPLDDLNLPFSLLGDHFSNECLTKPKENCVHYLNAMLQ